MTETWPVGGVRCEAGHLHFEPSRGLVEVLALPAPRPARPPPAPGARAPAPRRPGQPGLLVATPFAPYREASVVLRYATEDAVRVLEGAADVHAAAAAGHGRRAGQAPARGALRAGAGGLDLPPPGAGGAGGGRPHRRRPPAGPLRLLGRARRRGRGGARAPRPRGPIRGAPGARRAAGGAGRPPAGAAPGRGPRRAAPPPAPARRPARAVVRPAGRAPRTGGSRPPSRPARPCAAGA